MRISAGQLKGRKVADRRVFDKAGQGELRPTSSKVREALFDILRNDIRDSVFLDLYAGTGAVGFEALSRGASRAVFVEADRHLSKEISDSIRKMGIEGMTEVHTEEAGLFLKRAARIGASFDIIFVDPPYASDEIGKALPLIGESGIIREGGHLIVEHPAKKILPQDLPSLTLIKQYKYGDTRLTRYRKGT